MCCESHISLAALAAVLDLGPSGSLLDECSALTLVNAKLAGMVACAEVAVVAGYAKAGREVILP
jgi:hypothetical protein